MIDPEAFKVEVKLPLFNSLGESLPERVFDAFTSESDCAYTWPFIAMIKKQTIRRNGIFFIEAFEFEKNGIGLK